MNSLSKRIAISTAALALLAGCGGTTATPSTSSTTAVVDPSASSAATVPASEAPASSSVATDTPTASGQPLLPSIAAKHADPALESLLPTDVSGTALQVSSFSLSEMLDAGGDRATVDAFLRSIGKGEADGTVAWALDPTGKLTGGIIAYKISGADTATILPAIVSVEQSDLGTGATAKQATVGGRTVTVLSVGSGVNDTEWVYGRDDVVFVVHAGDESGAAAFLQALS